MISKHDIDMTKLLVNDIGLTVIQIGEGEGARYFVGTFQTPQPDEAICILTGYEVTHFYTDSLVKKSQEQVKLEILEYAAQAPTNVVKFPTHTKWWVYNQN